MIRILFLQRKQITIFFFGPVVKDPFPHKPKFDDIVAGEAALLLQGREEILGSKIILKSHLNISVIFQNIFQPHEHCNENRTSLKKG